MLKDAIKTIDQLIDGIDDARKTLPFECSRADLVDEEAIQGLVADMEGALTTDEAAEAERYLRLKVAA